ncbi:MULTISPECIES: hypothetical protein [unclassified Methylobacterium]|uniref:hypothetical protein n=1 Tax=unclassified Methylobacterium TaxID=2615210 RepID=UPI00226A344D|nr:MULTISPECIES: hypothetical protein [unclassified Methylobacterium]
MAGMNVSSIRRMIARLQANLEIQATLASHTFVVAGAVPMILDLNSRSQDYRHRLANEWCEALATGRWRRRICERRGNAVLDTVIFEFDSEADTAALNVWLTMRGW